MRRIIAAERRGRAGAACAAVGEENAVAQAIDHYTIVIRPDDNGTFVAELPAIDGCHAWGRTADEARAALDDVFGMIVDEHQQAGRGAGDAHERGAQ